MIGSAPNLISFEPSDVWQTCCTLALPRFLNLSPAKLITWCLEKSVMTSERSCELTWQLLTPEKLFAKFPIPSLTRNFVSISCAVKFENVTFYKQSKIKSLNKRNCRIMNKTTYYIGKLHWNILQILLCWKWKSSY